jgi:hypothetical protein
VPDAILQEISRNRADEFERAWNRAAAGHLMNRERAVQSPQRNSDKVGGGSNGHPYNAAGDPANER